MSYPEYRIVHRIPHTIVPLHFDSRDQAELMVETAERYLVQPGDLKIQHRTITEWEDV